jgi:hypothetical protein
MDEDEILEQPIYAINDKPLVTPYTPSTDYRSKFAGSATPIVIDNGKLNPRQIQIMLPTH